MADSLSLEIEDKLWGAGLAALDPRAAPDVLVMALRVAEILSRSRCRTCSSLPPKDGGLRLDAVTRVARALEAHPECGPVAVSAARSLQAMAGCATCRCFHDRASQDILGQGGAIEALVNTLMHACCAPQDNAPPPEHMW